MNTVWIVQSEDDRHVNPVRAVFTDHTKAKQYIADNDDDGWLVLVAYNGDTGRYLGQQD